MINVLKNAINKHDNLMKNVLFGHLNLISESKQLIPHVKDYYNIVWNKVSKITGIKDDNDFLNEQEKHYTISLTQDDFNSVDTFFISLNIIIDLTVTNEIGVFDYNGGYIPQRSMINVLNGEIVSLVEGDKLPIVKIGAVVKTSITTIQEAVAVVVYHEFTHAYEDLMRIKHSDKRNSIMAYSVYSNYNGLDVIRNSVPIYGKTLGDSLYLLKQIERNAFISQTIGEIEVKTIEWADKLPETIKSTAGYKNYETLFELIEELQNINDVNIQNQLLNTYNSNAGIIRKYNGENKKYKFKSYNQMVKWLKKKSVYCYHDFIERLARHFENNKIKNKFIIH